MGAAARNFSVFERNNVKRVAIDMADDSHSYVCQGNHLYPEVGYLVFVEAPGVWLAVNEDYSDSVILPNYLSRCNRGEVLQYMSDCERIFEKGVNEGREDAIRVLSQSFHNPEQGHIQ